MKPPAFDYAKPRTVCEALGLLRDHGDGARLLAGGQSLIPALRFRLATPAILVDLNGIAELEPATPAQTTDGTLVFGAMTRHRAFETGVIVGERLPLLQYAMRHVAHVQVRNRGTIGGSLCNADPAAEWPALCLACDAQMVVQGTGGRRRVEAKDFVTGLYATALGASEILVGIEFPAWPAGRRWGFQEMSRRRGDFAIVGVACTVDFDSAGRCERVRLAVFGAGERATLVPEASLALCGSVPRDAGVREAAKAARMACSPQSDQHASAAYRSELVEALALRALEQACFATQRTRHA
jgi:CO/xanthine dehydrogenase FAD-binding subunit